MRVIVSGLPSSCPRLNQILRSQVLAAAPESGPVLSEADAQLAGVTIT
jgi:hypothetical protein